MSTKFETITIILEPTHTIKKCKVVVLIYFDIIDVEEKVLQDKN